MRRWSVFLLLICLTGILSSACGTASGPESPVEAFFDAVEERDAEAALQCFTPELRGQYRSALQRSSVLFGSDPGAILSGIMGIPCPADGAGIEYRINAVRLPDQTHAYVEVYVDTGQAEEEVVFPCIKIRGKWYINER